MTESMGFSMDEWKEVAIEEYKQVWEENRIGQQNGVHMLQIGFTLITALFGSLLIPNVDPLFHALLLQWIIPCACYTILILWMNEIGRMVRAGNFLRILEERFNILLAQEGFKEHLANSSRVDFFKRNLLDNHYSLPALWHTWLRTPSPVSRNRPQGQLYGGYVLMVLLWLLAAVGAMVLAYVEGNQEDILKLNDVYNSDPTAGMVSFLHSFLWFHPAGCVLYVLAFSGVFLKAWRISRLN